MLRICGLWPLRGFFVDFAAIRMYFMTIKVGFDYRRNEQAKVFYTEASPEMSFI